MNFGCAGPTRTLLGRGSFRSPQHLNSNIAKIEGLAFHLDAEVAALTVQDIRFPGALAIDIHSDLLALDFETVFAPLIDGDFGRLGRNHRTITAN